MTLNLSVHMYGKIDYGSVFDILGASLDDLRMFSREMAKLI